MKYLKNIWKDESGAAYLLLVGLFLTLIVLGVAYAFTSDFVDYILASINSYNGTPLANQMDAPSLEIGNLLMMLFKFFLMPALIIIIYWVWVMSQKPARPY